jgi:hypothetical protein
LPESENATRYADGSCYAISITFFGFLLLSGGSDARLGGGCGRLQSLSLGMIRNRTWQDETWQEARSRTGLSGVALTKSGFSEKLRKTIRWGYGHSREIPEDDA